MFTFQKLIQQLSAFWEKQGCILQKGYDLEMGAGTFNPATFLFCLGPEPFRTAFVEPSRRPTDGRYGDNPNRLQKFHQFQVIIKPSPKDILRIYLKSLKAIGLNLKEHDIRFVQDDWEGPTLGAWGLGWEVWCDGMEITQFTYFQAMGTLQLFPVSAEITYGLERLAMYLQKVDHVLDLKWNEELTFRDLIKQQEFEWSKYNFEESNSEMWLRHFDDYEREAKSLIMKNLALPAYDFVLKASHAFNMLEARGVISVTERTGYIQRIRELAKQVALEYLEARKALDFPLLKKSDEIIAPSSAKKARAFNPKKKDSFLLEIGSEQLPATFVPLGVKSLERRIGELLKNHKLPHGKITMFGASRRIAILIEDLAEGTEDEVIEKKGPALSVAFTSSGTLSEQGKGFFRSLGIAECSLEQIKKKKDLEVRQINGQDYLFGFMKKKGIAAREILGKELPSLILNLDFPKKMRWNHHAITYPRPLQWLIALFGKTTIDFSIGNIKASNVSFGHMQLCDQKIKIPHASEYAALLKEHKVLVNIEERKAFIIDQIDALEKKSNGRAILRDQVMPEVLYLSEWPMLAISDFDREFLNAPAEVLTSEMTSHQRYFPMVDENGKLKNQFLIVCDNTPNDIIRKGNQKVLSARLFDGIFLYEQDLKVSLAEFNEKLKAMTFQKDLGSVYDKVIRIARHAQLLNKWLGLAEETSLLAAAELCKADLASALVKEFPELQGTIGKYYALVQGEDKEVAFAIEEHWMPTAENGLLPKTPSGMILSLADKIDNLLGYFGVGLKPTSSSDPYALRRQTIGLLKILLKIPKAIDLKQILAECRKHFTVPLDCDTSEILAYITTRAKSLFEEYGLRKDEIDASLSSLCSDPYNQLSKTQALHDFRTSPQFLKLYEVYKRAKGQIENVESYTLNPDLLEEKAEIALLKEIEKLDKEWKSVIKARDYKRAYDLIAELQPPLSHLFDTVLILCEDVKIRQNRIALLQKVFSYFPDLLDFSRIQAQSSS
jgi:glycyl-tRNA synthetase